MKQEKAEQEKVPLLWQTIKERFITADIGNSAVVVTYYLLLSLFPLIILLGNILPFFNLSSTVILPYLKQMFPAEIYQVLSGTIEHILSKSSGGLLSISAIAIIWTASKSINALQMALNKVYGVENHRNPIVVRLFSLGLTIAFLFALFIVLFLFVAGQALLDYLNPTFTISNQFLHSVMTLKWPLTSLLLFFILLAIYYFVPNVRTKLRYTVVGALFSTIGWLFLTQLFGLYVRFFSKSMNSYGLIGSFMLFMIWLNFAANVIIIGGVINAVLSEWQTGSIQPRASLLEKIKRTR